MVMVLGDACASHWHRSGWRPRHGGSLRIPSTDWDFCDGGLGIFGMGRSRTDEASTKGYTGRRSARCSRFADPPPTQLLAVRGKRLGTLLQEAGHKLKAREAYGKSLTLDPGFEDARAAL